MSLSSLPCNDYALKLVQLKTENAELAAKAASRYKQVYIFTQYSEILNITHTLLLESRFGVWPVDQWQIYNVLKSINHNL